MLRRRAGALLYDWPHFLRHINGDWTRLRNRNETLALGPRGARCEWEFSSELHIANVFPSAARWLLRRALATWPIALRDEPLSISAIPEVSFIIGHRGTTRLPNLLTTLRTIAAQTGTPIECIVIEQSAEPEIATRLPPWVRYLHTPVPPDRDYSRAATFNDGARIARGRVLILHDNDILVPERYAAEVRARASEGSRFIELKRFLFYATEADSRALFDCAPLHGGLTTTVLQNQHGGSIAVERAAYAAIGGFDASFVGWGGEDNEFWDRARAHGGVYDFGYLPMLHLWHPGQQGSSDRSAAPGVLRYRELQRVPAEERIRRLRGDHPSATR